jgi:HK97 family phage prohead protease
MDPERLHLPVQWKAAGDGSGEIEGHAAVFGNVDLQGDLILKGAFRKTLADWKRAKSKIPLVDGHLSSDSKSLLGSVTRAAEDDIGLKFRAAFSSDPDSQVVRTKALEGHLSGVSIGYLPMPGGVAFKQGDDGEIVRVLSEVRLFEISLTPVPANPEAQLTSVKSIGEADMSQSTVGLDQLDDQMRKVAAIGYAPARKAALAALLPNYHLDQPTDDGAAGHADGQPTAPAAAEPGTANHEPPTMTPERYALGIINPGPRDDAPEGEPRSAADSAPSGTDVLLAHAQQLLEGSRDHTENLRTSGDLDRLEAEINQALGRDQ